MKTSGLSKEKFDELFRLYYKDLTKFVFSFVNNQEIARDLTHDLFYNLWKNRLKLNPQKSIKAFLFTTARNQSLNYLKHQKVIASNEQGIAEEYNSSNDLNETEAIEQRLERVRRKLEKLPEKQYKVVVKCCIEGKLYKETALELSISENTVKTHLMRAMKFLREELREDFILFLLMKSGPKQQSL